MSSMREKSSVMIVIKWQRRGQMSWRQPPYIPKQEGGNSIGSTVQQNLELLDLNINILEVHHLILS